MPARPSSPRQKRARRPELEPLVPPRPKPPARAKPAKRDRPPSTGKPISAPGGFGLAGRLGFGFGS